MTNMEMNLYSILFKQGIPGDEGINAAYKLLWLYGYI